MSCWKSRKPAPVKVRKTAPAPVEISRTATEVEPEKVETVDKDGNLSQSQTESRPSAFFVQLKRPQLKRPRGNRPAAVKRAGLVVSRSVVVVDKLPAAVVADTRPPTLGQQQSPTAHLNNHPNNQPPVVEEKKGRRGSRAGITGRRGSRNKEEVGISSSQKNSRSNSESPVDGTTTCPDSAKESSGASSSGGGGWRQQGRPRHDSRSNTAGARRQEAGDAARKNSKFSATQEQPRTRTNSRAGKNERTTRRRESPRYYNITSKSSRRRHWSAEEDQQLCTAGSEASSEKMPTCANNTSMTEATTPAAAQEDVVLVEAKGGDPIPHNPNNTTSKRRKNKNKSKTGKNSSEQEQQQRMSSMIGALTPVKELAEDESSPMKFSLPKKSKEVLAAESIKLQTPGPNKPPTSHQEEDNKMTAIVPETNKRTSHKAQGNEQTTHLREGRMNTHIQSAFLPFGVRRRFPRLRACEACEKGIRNHCVAGSYQKIYGEKPDPKVCTGICVGAECTGRSCFYSETCKGMAARTRAHAKRALNNANDDAPRSHCVDNAGFYQQIYGKKSPDARVHNTTKAKPHRSSTRICVGAECTGRSCFYSEACKGRTKGKLGNRQ